MTKWRMEYDSDENGNHWWNIDEVNQSTDTKHLHDRTIGNVYDKEDAKLVAASPDLLEACESVIEWFEKFEITHSITFEGASELVNKTTAAIAKAKGE